MTESSIAAPFQPQKDIYKDRKSESALENQENFENQLERIKTHVLQVQRVCELPDQITQLAIINEQLWALADDHINILDEAGHVLSTLRPGFHGAADISTFGDNLAVVASLYSGLILINTSGQLVKTIDDGYYRSVTNSEGTLWAVKEEQLGFGIYVCMYVVKGDDFVLVQKFQTDILSGGYVTYCAALKDKLYISSFTENCVYEVSEKKITNVFGKHKDDSLTVVHGPRILYSDTTANSLLVVDFKNNRLKILEPQANDWFVVEMDGEELYHPIALTCDPKGHIWVTCIAPRALFKCTLIGKQS